MLLVVLGRKEMGKTTLGYSMVEKAPRRAIFDPRQRIRRGGVTVRKRGHLEDAFAMLHEQDAIEILHSPIEDDTAAEFNRFAKHVKAWIEAHGESADLAVMVDEIAIAEIDKSKTFEWCIKCCESDRVHFVLTGHRPVDVPANIRALVNHWFFFQVTESRDLNVVDEVANRQVSDAVQQLPPRHFIQWDANNRKAILFPNPASWYIPLRLEHPVAPSMTDLSSSLEGGIDRSVDIAPLFR